MVAQQGLEVRHLPRGFGGVDRAARPYDRSPVRMVGRMRGDLIGLNARRRRLMSGMQTAPNSPLLGKALSLRPNSISGCPVDRSRVSGMLPLGRPREEARQLGRVSSRCALVART